MRTGIAGEITGQAVATGVSSALLGYASSVAVVITGLTAAGATTGQVTSALLGLGIGMAVLSVGLSAWTRVPVAVVWSTPGVALLATLPALDGGFAQVVGGFVVCGLLIAVTGLFAPLTRLLVRLPPALTSAVLAGVLLPFCLAAARGTAEIPLQAGAIVLAWAVAIRFRPAWASSVALAALVAVVAVQGGLGRVPEVVPRPEIVTPAFGWEGLVQVALPLYLVTMAAQNLVGVAVLGAQGYRAPVGRVLVATGLGSAAVAPLGAPSLNLAAITGALTAGPAAHADPARRWVAAASGGLTYLALAAIAPLTSSIVTGTDPRLVATTAGLALLTTFAASAARSLENEETRIAAAVTLAVTASGLTVLGLGSAPWGLLAGGALLLIGVGRPHSRGQEVSGHQPAAEGEGAERDEEEDAHPEQTR